MIAGGVETLTENSGFVFGYTDFLAACSIHQGIDYFEFYPRDTTLNFPLNAQVEQNKLQYFLRNRIINICFQ